MENNKNVLIAIMSVAVVAMVLSIATLAITISIQGGLNQVRDTTSTLAARMPTETADTRYLLREYNGVIGVFDDTGVLTELIEVDVKSLPEADRVMLGTGIWAMSRRELAALIEDYTG